MPFGEGWEAIYQGLIAPPLTSAGYEVARADTFLSHQNVLRDIIRGIRDADLVVADITTPNPNVYYELGIAQSLGVPTVLIAQDFDEVPFDLRSYRIVQYSTEFSEVDDFRERLKQIGLEHMAGRVEFGNPVQDFVVDPGVPNLPGLKNLDDQLKSRERAAKNEGADEPAGFLDHVLMLEDSTAALEALFLDVTEDLTSLSHGVTSKAATLAQLGEQPRATNPREVFRITTSIANDITAFSQSLDRRLPEIESRTQDLINAGGSVSSWVAEGVEESPDRVLEFKESMSEFGSAVTMAIEQMSEMRESTGSVRGVSRELDRASSRIQTSLGRLIDAMTQIQAFAIRSRDLASEALQVTS